MKTVLRDSGVGWLGDIPAGWSVVPARALFGERKQKSSATDVHLTPSQKYGVVPQAEYMEITGNKVVLNLSGADKMRHVEAGDYVSHLRSFQGGLEFAGMSGKVSAAYTVLKPKLPLEPRFFKYLFKSDLYIQALQTTTDQLRDGQSIRNGQFTLIPLPYPGLGEQRAIADYLDRETAQIDAFIAKNEELITLLTERRAAATFRLVTGLDGTEVPPKSVKADWFRAVPQTWDVAPLYTMAKTFAGGTPKSDAEEYWTDDDDDGVEWIAIGDMRAVQAGYPHSGRRVTAAGLEAAGLTPRSGPLVLFAMYASVGEVAMLRRPAVWNQAILGIRANPSRLNERYLYWALLALRPKLGIYFRSNTQDNLNATQVRGLRLPVPPLDEQLAIADQLEETWASVDEAIATAQRGVGLARERRAALISAAVTGKIDVGVAV